MRPETCAPARQHQVYILCTYTRTDYLGVAVAEPEIILHQVHVKVLLHWRSQEALRQHHPGVTERLEEIQANQKPQMVHSMG